LSDAAKESNLPSRGLPGPASFEDWMGHQARAAPALILCGGAMAGTPPPSAPRRPEPGSDPPSPGAWLEAVLEGAFDAGVEGIQPVQRERFD
jgi:hypothetical protein